MSYREIDFFFFLRFPEQNMSYREIEIILFFSEQTLNGHPSK